MPTTRLDRTPRAGTRCGSCSSGTPAEVGGSATYSRRNPGCAACRLLLIPRRTRCQRSAAAAEVDSPGKSPFCFVGHGLIVDLRLGVRFTVAEFDDGVHRAVQERPQHRWLVLRRNVAVTDQHGI